jgi:predicted phosphodiesterase
MTPLPKSLAVPHKIVEINNPGVWLILADTHLPHHDENTINLALRTAKRMGAIGILLNGDILDSAQISRHERHNSAIKYRDEISMGISFLRHVRETFPKARILYKEGNHEQRLEKYIDNKADALEGLEGMNLSSFLKMKDARVEWFPSGTIIKLGKLPTIHGHEFGGSGGGGVSPARWLYSQAGDCCVMGHCHRTSEHHERTLLGYIAATWTVGCACDLSPHWRLINKWNLGFAIVEVDRSKDFLMSNKRIVSGKVV